MATSEPILPSEPVNPVSQPVGSSVGNEVGEEDSPAEDLLSISPPSPLDWRIYLAHRAGRTVKQLARSQNLTSQEIHQALFRVHLDNERNSSLVTGIETRRLFLAHIDDLSTAATEALRATKLVGKKVVMVDKETGEAVTLEETVELPDHDTRLKAMDSMRHMVAVVQPKDPAVVVNNTNNTQNNVLAVGAGGGGNGHGTLTSPEAVIRAITAERAQKALAAPVAPAFVIPTSKPTATLEGVPVMAQDPEQPEGEYEDEELDETEDSENESDLDEDEDDSEETEEDD